MSISPIGAVSISPLQSPTAIPPVSIAALASVASSAQIDLAAIRNNSITVDVSTMGQLLNSTARLQSKQASLFNPSLAANAATQADASQTSASKQDITTIAELFVNSFNQLQSSNSDLNANPLISSSNDSLLQTINAGTASTLEKSLFEQLAKIGINLQRTPLPGSNTLLTLDVVTFQAALAQNPGGTLTLLTQALQILGNAENNFIAQNQELISGSVATSTSTGQLAADNTANTSNTPISTSNVTEQVPVNTDAVLQQVLTGEALQSAISSNNSTPLVTNTANVTNTVEPSQEPGIAQAAATGAATTTTTTSAAASTALPAATVATIGNPVDAVTSADIPSNVSSNANVTTSKPSISNNADTSLADNVLTNIASPTSLLNNQATSALIPNTPTSVQENVFNQNQATVVSALNATGFTDNSPPITTTGAAETAVAIVTSQLNETIAPSSNSINRVNDKLTTAVTSTKAQVAPNNGNSPAVVVNASLPSTVASNIAGNSTLASTSAPETITRTLAGNSPASTTPATTPNAVENEVIVNASTAALASPQTAINPLISAAVAAYRLREGLTVTPLEKPDHAPNDAVTAPEAVTAVKAVELNLHEHTSPHRQEEEAQLAYHQTEDLGQDTKTTDAATHINVDA